MIRVIAVVLLGLAVGLSLVPATGSAQVTNPAQPIQRTLDLHARFEFVENPSALAQAPATDAVVVGTLLAAQPPQLAASKLWLDLVYTDWTVRVDRAIRNSEAGEIITVRVLGGRTATVDLRVFQNPALQVGEEALLFLTQGQELLLSSDEVFGLVGEGHGVYIIRGGMAENPLHPSRNRPAQQAIREASALP